MSYTLLGLSGPRNNITYGGESVWQDIRNAHTVKASIERKEPMSAVKGLMERFRAGLSSS
jgi:hypothetical protein